MRFSAINLAASRQLVEASRPINSRVTYLSIPGMARTVERFGCAKSKPPALPILLFEPHPRLAGDPGDVGHRPRIPARQDHGARRIDPLLHHLERPLPWESGHRALIL